MDQAVRALASVGVGLTAAQSSELRKWSAPDGSFLYTDFLDDVHAGLGETKGLEQRPDELLATLEATESLGALSGAGLSGSPPALSAAEQAAADAALGRVGKLCASRGVHLPAFLRQFDRSGRGVVTVSQLDRALANALPAASAADRAALAKAFTWDAGTRSARVSARELARAVHAAAEALQPAMGAPPGPVPGSASGPAWPGAGEVAFHPGLVSTASLSVLGAHASAAESKEAEELPASAARCLSALRRQALERRLRVKDVFVDFDPLHRGAVTLPQFVRALLALPLSGLSAVDFEALGRAFPDDRRGRHEASVDYLAVCERVEAAFGAAPHAETDPTAEPPRYGAAAGLTCRAGAAGAVAAEAEAFDPELPERLVAPLASALRWIRTRIRQRRVELVGVFKDYDRTHEEHVTAAQFLRALRTLGLMPEGPFEADALLAQFRGQGATRASHVNWRRFRDAVDAAVEEDAARRALVASQEGAEAAARERSGRAAAAAAGARTDARALLARLKAWAVRDGVRVGEFLRDSDPLRRGLVPASKVVAALSAGGFRVAAGDEAALASAYRAAGGGADAAGRALVDWRALNEDVEAAFGPAGLEAAPDADVEGLRAAALLGTRSLAGREAELGLAGGGAAPVSAEALLQRFAAGRGGTVAAGAMLAAGAAAVSGETADRLSDSEAREVEAALGRVGVWAETRRVDLPPVFLGFDRLHHGSLPEAQFRRCLSVLRLPFSRRETDLVCRALASVGPDGRGDVSWVWLEAGLRQPAAVLAALPPSGAVLGKAGAADATGIGAAWEAGAGGGGGSGATPLALAESMAAELRGAGAGGGGAALEEALEEVRRRCAARRLSIKEHLAAHDRLNRGVITAVKLRAAMVTAGLRLAPRTLGALEAGFRNDRDGSCVDWRALCEAVEGGGGEAAGLEKDPLALPASHRPRVPMADGQVADAHGAEAVAAPLSEVRRQVHQRRIDLKSKLMDFDRQRRGVLAASRFRSVLAAEIRVLAPASLDALSKAFASRDAPGMVAWRPFLAAVESGESA